MTTIAWKNQHAELDVLQLAPPFWGKPRIAALIASWADEIQLAENTLFKIVEQFTIDGALDLVRLEAVGRAIGQPRFGFDLEDYRRLLRARALANRTQGRPEDLRAILDIVFEGAPYDVVPPTAGARTIQVVLLAMPSDVNLRMARLLLPDVRAGGIGLRLYYGATPPARWGVSTWGTPTEWATVEVL